jgi:hypothetical protein
MNDLSELFDRNPLRLTDDDVAVIVKRLREGQAQYELGVKLPRAAKGTKKPKAAEGPDLLKDLDL